MFYLNNLCSLCLAHNKKLTPRSSINSSAEDLLQRIIPEFEQQMAGIPTKLCDDCVNSFAAVFKFRRKCLGNITILNEYISKLQYGYESYSYRNLSVKIDDIKFDIKKEIKDEIILDDDICSLEDDLRSNYLKLENIREEHSFSRNLNEEKNGNDLKSDVALSVSNESGTEETDEPANQDVEFKERFECTECGEDLPNRIRNSSLKCQKCQTISRDTNTLKSVKVRSHSCNTCQKSFRTPFALRQHKVVHSGKKPFCCSFCGNKFTQHGSLKSHQQKFHTNGNPFVCNICQKGFAFASNLRKHKLTHSEKIPFECEFCGRRFALRSTLIEHKRIHPGKTYRCNFCAKKFARSLDLRLHRKTHRYEKRHLCTICKKSFAGMRNLKRHMTVHEGEKAFTCDVCLKNFSSAWNLRVHERIHNGIKPFACSVCNKSYHTKDNRNRHERNNHKGHCGTV